MIVRITLLCIQLLTFVAVIGLLMVLFLFLVPLEIYVIPNRFPIVLGLIVLSLIAITYSYWGTSLRKKLTRNNTGIVLSVLFSVILLFVYFLIFSVIRPVGNVFPLNVVGFDNSNFLFPNGGCDEVIEPDTARFVGFYSGWQGYSTKVTCYGKLQPQYCVLLMRPDPPSVNDLSRMVFSENFGEILSIDLFEDCFALYKGFGGDS